MVRVDGERIHVELVYCPRPGEADVSRLALPAGATLADALAASGVLARHGLQAADLSLSIWGTLRPATTPLRDRDRVELCRPLQVDPKEARRQRYRSQGRESRRSR
jgi:uncharacterized protein